MSMNMFQKEPEFKTINDKYFLFNVFENVEDNTKFKDFWDEKAQYVKTVEHFHGTYLHSTENKKYSWVNFAIFDSDDVCVFGKPDENWKREIKTGSDRSFKAFPAGYREVASSNNLKYTSESEQVGEGFILTLLEVEDKTKIEDLLSNWRVTTGTDLLHEKLSSFPDSKVSSSHLFRRFTMMPKFSLVVRTSVTFDDPESGLKFAEELNKMIKPDEGVKITFGYYMVEVIYTK